MSSLIFELFHCPYQAYVSLLNKILKSNTHISKIFSNSYDEFEIVLYKDVLNL